MNKFQIVFVLVTLLFGIAIGVIFSQSDSEEGNKQQSEPENKILFYRNPMNPEVVSDVPAKDSMGMDYIPVFENEDVSSEGSVSIDPVFAQNIGVRTSKAVRTDFGRTVRAVGRVSFDEQRIIHLHPKVDGWVDSIRVDKTGETVEKNDILLSLYSPKLVATQQEYLLALKNLEELEESKFEDIRVGAESLVKTTRQRLELLDVPEHQIRELEESKEIKNTLHIHAPGSGTVIKIGVRKGEFVSPKTELYMLVDLNRVWVYADIYEYELPWIKEGDEALMTLASVPGKTFKGRLDYIYPYAEAKSRTTKVRIIFDNKDLLLRPEMFADIQIKSDVKKSVVVIPSEAVVRSGNRSQVFIVKDQGKFEPREVTLGVNSDGRVVVMSGLNEGEEVVTSSQFLVDSESKLNEATAKMRKAGASDSPQSDVMASDDESPASMENDKKLMDEMSSEGHSHD